MKNAITIQISKLGVVLQNLQQAWRTMFGVVVELAPTPKPPLFELTPRLLNQYLHLFLLHLHLLNLHHHHYFSLQTHRLFAYDKKGEKEF